MKKEPKKEKKKNTTPDPSSPALHLSTAVNFILQGVMYIVFYLDEHATHIAKCNAALENLIVERKEFCEMLKNKNAEIEKLKEKHELTLQSLAQAHQTIRQLKGGRS